VTVETLERVWSWSERLLTCVLYSILVGLVVICVWLAYDSVLWDLFHVRAERLRRLENSEIAATAKAEVLIGPAELRE